MLFTGIPFITSILLLPQRFQNASGTSALGAGIRLLPFAFSCAVGSIASAMIAGKLKVPPLYLLLGASGLQIVGFALLSISSTNPAVGICGEMYVYEIIAALGVGVCIALQTVLVPFTVEKRDQGRL